MSKKIILIRPWNEFHVNNYPPLNLLMLGTALMRNGFTVKIIHYEDRKNWEAKIKHEIDRSVIAICITAFTSEIRGAITIASFLKTITKIPIIWGGWHSTLFPEQMAASPLVDYVISGEGDESLPGLIKDIDAGKRPLNKIRYSKRLDLNSLPVPCYDLDEDIEFFIKAKLTDKFQEYVKRDFRWLPYQSSRGCPHRCGFCINVVTNNQLYKKKTAEKVVDEIALIKEKFRITHIKFIDDNFFVDVDRAKTIAAGFIDKNLNITWDAECRVDYFTKDRVNMETLKLLKDSGLLQLTFGVESGSEVTLKIMKKDISPQQVLQAISACDSLGLTTRCSFVLDVPGDTRESLFESAKLIKKLRNFKKCACGVHTYRPYPKSELCQKLISDGVIRQPECLEDWDNQRYVRQFTSTDVVRKWQRNYKLSSRISFYQSLESAMWLKPHQIDNRIARFINNLFIRIAKLRNESLFYGICVDKPLYIVFKNWYYGKLSQIRG